MVQRSGLISRLRKSWKPRSTGRKLFDIALVLFAAAGAAIIGAWGLYQLGVTNNRGAVDKNYRYMMSVSEIEEMKQAAENDTAAVQREWATQYARLAALSHFYPVNARLISQGAQYSDNPYVVNRMIAAAEVYMENADDYRTLVKQMNQLMKGGTTGSSENVIPWMNSIEWKTLKQVILRDSALINEAGRLTGVEPRLIAGCLIGEQIRLFNSKREMFKKYLGPVKVLSVQSQFSFGVNGIKIHTAQAVEEHLKDHNSVYYMGRQYEDLLNFETANHEQERYNRLVDYRNHLYSYIYTGCILHQTMLQWRRAGYDISNRPDILFTLFNVGFSQSEPKPDPVCGGSRIEVNGNIYTFGAIGFDFYYSGELAKAFPYWKERFVQDNGQRMTDEEIKAVQDNMSDSHGKRHADTTAEFSAEPDYESLPVTPAISF